jgi:hypothetical protein
MLESENFSLPKSKCECATRNKKGSLFKGA